MVNVDYKPEFRKLISKINEQKFKLKVKKIIGKIIKNPELGKPMQHNRKGTRELYLKPFRISYLYKKSEDLIVFLIIYHKDKQ